MRSILPWILPFCFFSLGCQNHTIKEICFKTTCVNVEIADTPQKRKTGLMFRANLADNQGMLFVFAREAPVSFWMKNMIIPLDILWIDSQRRVVDIKTNVRPCGVTCESLIPKKSAKFVLEVGVGFVRRHRVEINDKVHF